MTIAAVLPLSWTKGVLSVASGGAVGFSLGLVGGGGSILAVPALVYIVGVPDPHVAIGTSALAVAGNAFANLVGYWRAGNVRWPCASIFAVTGIIGAALGSSFGKLVGGQHLLFLFALAMIGVGVAMLKRPAHAGDPGMRATPAIALRLGAIALSVGALAGFFGIGGGFLIVPGLMLGTGMPLIDAIGSSLLSVGTFGLTTATNYAVSGFVDWSLALLFLIGGIGGGLAGMQAALRLARKRRALTYVFVGLIFSVATYMLIRTGLPAWASLR
jgi:uncharacterized protein